MADTSKAGKNSRDGTFIKLPTELLCDTSISAQSIRVWAYLLDRKGDNSDAWPGVRRMSKDVAMSITSLLESISELEQSGWLTVERPTGRGGRDTNRYTLLRTVQWSAPVSGAQQPVELSAPPSRALCAPVSGAEQEPVNNNQEQEGKARRLNLPRVPSPEKDEAHELATIFCTLRVGSPQPKGRSAEQIREKLRASRFSADDLRAYLTDKTRDKTQFLWQVFKAVEGPSGTATPDRAAQRVPNAAETRKLFGEQEGAAT